MYVVYFLSQQRILIGFISFHFFKNGYLLLNSIREIRPCYHSMSRYNLLITYIFFAKNNQPIKLYEKIQLEEVWKNGSIFFLLLFITNSNVYVNIIPFSTDHLKIIFSENILLRIKYISRMLLYLILLSLDKNKEKIQKINMILEKLNYRLYQYKWLNPLQIKLY